MATEIFCRNTPTSGICLGNKHKRGRREKEIYEIPLQMKNLRNLNDKTKKDLRQEEPSFLGKFCIFQLLTFAISYLMYFPTIRNLIALGCFYHPARSYLSFSSANLPIWGQWMRETETLPSWAIGGCPRLTAKVYRILESYSGPIGPTQVVTHRP